MTSGTQHQDETGPWAVDLPTDWAPGLDAVVHRSPDGRRHWRLLWHAQQLDRGIARTRLGVTVAVLRARRRWRDAGPAVGALLQVRQADANAGSEAESRLLNRRCRCGQLATAPVTRCEWHPSVSAVYAEHLQRIIADLLAVPLPGERAESADA